MKTMKKQYDYLCVGSGFYSTVFAQQMKENGKTCLIIDKRSHIGGNAYTENKDGINIHKMGPHIFHCSDDTIWNYVNRFAKFNHFRNSPKVNYKGDLYSFPINLMTLYQIYGVKTPEEAKKKLDEVRIKNHNPKNLEEWILSQVGPEIYNTFIKGYTSKQWNKDPKELPASIIKRLPIRFNFDDNYFTDCYQGIPIGGYTQMFEKMLEGIDIKLNCEYFKDKTYFDSLADKVLYTGMIDEYYDYKFGELEYRGLKFEHKRLRTPDYQGNAVINYTEKEIPHTRISEWKHFDLNTTNKVTWITTEYPADFKRGDIPYYPVRDEKNTKIYNKYKELADTEEKVIFGGRLGLYQYYDMHQIIGSALKLAKDQLNDKNI